MSARLKRCYTPLSINGTPVERVDTFKYLCVQITEDLTLFTHLDTVVKKARQRLYHLRRLNEFRASKTDLQSFYSSTIESFLTGCITAWYGNTTMQDRGPSAKRTIGEQLSNLRDIYSYVQNNSSVFKKVNKAQNPYICNFLSLGTLHMVLHNKS